MYQYPDVAPSDVGNADLLAQLKTYLAASVVHLYQNSFVPTHANVLADFTAAEANFTGYASVTPTWSAIGIDANGNAVMVSTRCFFQASDAVAPNVIGGLWVESAGGVLEFYIPLTTPVSIQAALNFLAATLTFSYPSQGNASIES